ncbi:unnamed protein product [Lupinus luteus]|uniref:Uncharacterized protein n=1 Tax=Lupinus luteus TaxID=3873 RepID=A0AAV1VXF2_LUPLU
MVVTKSPKRTEDLHSQITFTFFSITNIHSQSLSLSSQSPTFLLNHLHSQIEVYHLAYIS